VLELATGGEMFDYICAYGKFEEPLARYYFTWLMQGLAYINGKNICHRDLKLENIFFDDAFNLKIADFGFSNAPKGKEGKGLSTKLGTPGFMAPEVILKKIYDGEKADVFSCGVILYIMCSQLQPFGEAKSKDVWYKTLITNNDLYWTKRA